MTDRAVIAVLAALLIGVPLLLLVPKLRRFDVGLLIFGGLWVASMLLQRG